jgi:hypothetical protein
MPTGIHRRPVARLRILMLIKPAPGIAQLLLSSKLC